MALVLSLQVMVAAFVPATRISSLASSTESSLTAVVDPNTYNVKLETAADLWTVKVSAQNSIDRPAGIPYLDSKSKDYFVDDIQVVLERDEESPSLGLSLVELAGGREDGYGLTIVEEVSGHAAACGILPGDSVASVEWRTINRGSGLDSEEKVEILDCECKDFDTTMDTLISLPSPTSSSEGQGEKQSLVFNLKRIRRWPRVEVIVEYPPSQCADGADNTETLSLFAGENLRRALLNRKIVLEDPLAKKCDFCGTKCTVRVEQGMELLSPMSSTEEKLLKKNPKCRVSCKTTVAPNMEEGTLRIKINLNEWNRDRDDKKNFFF